MLNFQASGVGEMTLLIGIMADSHGQTRAIEAALAALERLACRTVYHLGDVCDSTRPETAEACLRLLMEQRVVMIKGNNDHAIIANHANRPIPFDAPEVWRYLQTAPLIRRYQNAVFAHSLPFVETLGLSSMIGNMGESEAKRSFKTFPRHIIFRGHGHSPEIVRPQGRGILSRSIRPGETIDLAGKLPAVVTCGALTRGSYMVWNPQESFLKILSLSNIR
jgi:predicted phosphodiesterase